MHNDFIESELKDQIAMAFLGVIEQAMSIVTVEEGGSSSTPRLMRCRRYINHDPEASHLRL
jgi:hypothetical protein